MPAYLFGIAADFTVFPFRTAQLLNLLSKVVIGGFGKTVVDAWQCSSKEAFLSAVATQGTATSFVFGREEFIGGGACGQQRSRGADEV